MHLIWQSYGHWQKPAAIVYEGETTSMKKGRTVLGLTIDMRRILDEKGTDGRFGDYLSNTDAKLKFIFRFFNIFGVGLTFVSSKRICNATTIKIDYVYIYIFFNFLWYIVTKT